MSEREFRPQSADDSKMFVGGLNPKTTREKLIEFFTKYGEVSECRLPMKEYMNESKGFAFMAFKDLGSLQAAVTDGPQYIDGRRVETRMAGPKLSRPEKYGVSVERSNRVFVGGVRDQHSRDVLRHFFSEFGPVLAVECFADRNTGKCRGFAFVVFENCDTAERLIEQRIFNICGHQVEVKPANRVPQRLDRDHRNHRLRFEDKQFCDIAGQNNGSSPADRSGSRTSREEEFMQPAYLPPPSWGNGMPWQPHFALPHVYPPMHMHMTQPYVSCGMMPFPEMMATPPPGFWMENEPQMHVPHIKQEFTEDAYYEPYFAST